MHTDIYKSIVLIRQNKPKCKLQQMRIKNYKDFSIISDTYVINLLILQE